MQTQTGEPEPAPRPPDPRTRAVAAVWPTDSSAANPGHAALSPTLEVLTVVDICVPLGTALGPGLVRFLRTCRALAALLWDAELLEPIYATFSAWMLGRRGVVPTLQRRWAGVWAGAPPPVEADNALLGAAREGRTLMGEWLLTAAPVRPSAPTCGVCAAQFARRGAAPQYVAWLITAGMPHISPGDVLGAFAAVCEWGKLADIQLVYRVFAAKGPRAQKEALTRCLQVSRRLACHAHVSRWAQGALTTLQERHVL